MDHYRIKHAQDVKLKDFDPNDTSRFDGDKDKAKQELARLNAELETLQELLYAGHRHRVLIILQGMDTSGKDGVIRQVFDGVNPQGVRVASFKAPTGEELDHDYLWRVHRHTPGKGEMVIFNRSHYEDVLIVRVHELVAARIWKRRYAQIKDFERLLAEEGTLVLKFFLHIDADEQKKRLLARIDAVDKQWKFNPGDLKERELWDDYQRAYEEALSRTSTRWAPWYVVPANKKWYRNLVIASVLVGALKQLKMNYPPQAEDLAPYRQELAGEAS